MTEPQVASSDATNMELEIRRDGDEYVLNGRKWWTTMAINPRCKIMLVMGKSNHERLGGIWSHTMDHQITKIYTYIKILYKTSLWCNIAFKMYSM